MSFTNDVTKKAWPRWAVSPEGNRARFDGPGDVPTKWTLEIPLAGSAAPAPVAPSVAEMSTEALMAELATRKQANKSVAKA